VSSLVGLLIGCGIVWGIHLATMARMRRQSRLADVAWVKWCDDAKAAIDAGEPVRPWRSDK
jgi:hypothetical protein